MFFITFEENYHDKVVENTLHEMKDRHMIYREIEAFLDINMTSANKIVYERKIFVCIGSCTT